MDRLTTALSDERLKSEELNGKLRDKDIAAKQDLKTQASLFEGDIAKLKCQIVNLQLETTNKGDEVEKLKGDISTKESKIANMATQREKQNKAMERWSDEHMLMENFVLRTLPRAIDSLKEIRPSVAGTNPKRWPTQDAIHNMEYKKKVATLEEIFMSTVEQVKTINDEAAASIHRISDEKATEAKVRDQKLASEQENARKKAKALNDLTKQFETCKASQLESEEGLKAQSESLSRDKAKLIEELKSKDKELAASKAEAANAKGEVTKIESKVRYITNL